MTGINFKDNNTGIRKERLPADPAERQTGKEEPYAYVFKDANLGEMPVVNTANAWWVDSQKLNKLVDAYKFYATDDQACFYAGISIGQLKYFQELHPDFLAIKHAAKQEPTLRAKRTIVKTLDSDNETAKWWAERVEKGDFSTRTENVGPGGKDIYDNLTKEIKELGEKLRNNLNDDTNDTTEEHASGQTGGDTNTEPQGDRHDTAITENVEGGEDIPASTSETV